MSHPREITIVGGGLAGLTLGIGLLQRGVPATVWEAGRYPRHRVCGEFISGLGQQTLIRFGLLDGLRDAGASQAASVALFSENRRTVTHSLAKPALCSSRFVLDEYLAHEFQRLGGELRMGQRWIGDFGLGIVRAGGRRAEPVTGGWRLFGLKVHARAIPLEADLEMHFVPSGYVGLCRLGGGDVNICGLFRTKVPVPGLALAWREWLSGPPGSVLHSRLDEAQFDRESFCSVAGVGLRACRAIQREDCCVGDSLTMIPPLTGNGMSMAFESAELAIPPLEQFSRGELGWQEAQGQIAEACDRRFASRLRWAAWIQRALFQPAARSLLLNVAMRSDWIWRAMHERTR